MEKKQDQNSTVLQYIIEEVDSAREVYQLYEQLHKALPINNSKDLKKACDADGNLHFRDSRVSHSLFEGYIPEFIFPIINEKSLILRLAQFVKLMPPEVGYSVANTEYNKRFTQMKFLGSLITKVNINSISGVSGVKGGLSEELKK